MVEPSQRWPQPHGDIDIKEEELKAGKEKVLGLYKVVEAYLLKNTYAYA